jgi:RHS repeat-associated protein
VGEITRDSIFLSAGLLVDSTVTWFCEPNCTKRFRVFNTYNTRGERTGVYPVGPAGVTLTNRTYSYTGSTGTLASITLPGQTTSFGYDARLLGTTTTFPGTENTLIRTFTTVADRSRIIAPAAYSGVVSRDIELDTLSRVRAQYRDDNNGVKFTYDGLGRLAVARYQYRLQGSCTSDPDYGHQCVDNILDYEETFAYDAAGNRTDLSGTYDPGNRLAYFDGWTVSQDLDGNDTSKVGNGQTHKFKWTAEGRLDSAYANGSWYHLRYGAEGVLVGWDVGGTAMARLVWDGGNVLAETNGAITSKLGEYSSYPGGLDEPHAFITAAGAQHILHRDGLGNVIATTDQSKSVVQQVTYGTWGKEEGVSEPDGYGQRMRWKGALSLQPELGMVYLRARWYDPDLGRFASEDPIGLEGGMNPYVFGGGDPVNSVDPTGTTCRWVATWKYTFTIYSDKTWVITAEQTGERWACEDGDTGEGYGNDTGPGGGGSKGRPRAGGGGGPGSGNESGGDEEAETPTRTPQECFDQSTAPVREFAADQWETILGLSAVASVVRFSGILTERRGLVLRNYKGRPMLGRAMIRAGQTAFNVATVPVVVGAGTTAAYFAATSVICDLFPNSL